MSVTPAYFLSLAADCMENMLLQSEVWRAIANHPDAEWSTLQAIITAGSADEDEAERRILHGRAINEVDHPDYIERPYVVLRQFDGNIGRRSSTTSFDFVGRIYVQFEVPVPEAYAEHPQDAFEDARNKIGGIVQEILLMPMEAGNLHLTGADLQFGQADPQENNGCLFYVLDVIFSHTGSVLP
jgi:hypothetical protein